MPTPAHYPRPGELWYRVLEAGNVPIVRVARCLRVAGSWVTWGNPECGDKSWREHGLYWFSTAAEAVNSYVWVKAHALPEDHSAIFQIASVCERYVELPQSLDGDGIEA